MKSLGTLVTAENPDCVVGRSANLSSVCSLQVYAEVLRRPDARPITSGIPEIRSHRVDRSPRLDANPGPNLPTGT